MRLVLRKKVAGVGVKFFTKIVDAAAYMLELVCLLAMLLLNTAVVVILTLPVWSVFAPPILACLEDSNTIIATIIVYTFCFASWHEGYEPIVRFDAWLAKLLKMQQLDILAEKHPGSFPYYLGVVVLSLITTLLLLLVF